MSEEFFIRIGTRMLGSATAHEIRQMAAQGQFTKLHQVSTDGQNWTPASAHPELFGEATVAVTATQEDAALEPAYTPHSAPPTPSYQPPSVVEPQPAEPVAQPEPEQEAFWEVIIESEQFGPYSTSEVERFIEDGRIAKGDRVWQEGMPDWLPIEKVFRSVRRRKVPKEKKPKKLNHFVPPEEQTRSILAIASLVFSLLWGFGLTSVIAIIIGVLAIYDIATSRGKTTGIWFALAGVVFGIAGSITGAMWINEFWLK